MNFYLYLQPHTLKPFSKMRKFISTFIIGVVLSCPLSFAQDNSVADSIIGEYIAEHQGEVSKVRISKEDDGTYTARVIWVKNRTDKDGSVRLDEKNPDKSLRGVPCDEIVLIRGLKYNPEKKRWSDAKIYDPIRGIRANVMCEFIEGAVLRVKGSLLGFSQSVYWQKN